METHDDFSLEQFEKEADEIYRLMQDLSSTDISISEDASKRIREYVEDKKRARDEKELIEGCKTASHRIQITEDKEEKRKKLSEEFRRLGNECFRSGEFEKAQEYYSSAILQSNSNYILYNNRAQANLRLENFEEAMKDAATSMKINPSVIKTYVILARALRGQKVYHKALEVLQTVKKDFNNLNEAETKVIVDLETEIQEEISDAEESIKKLKKIIIK